MNRPISVWLSAGLLIIFTTVSAIPHSGATGVVKQRMDGMVMLGNQLKLLNPMFSGISPLDLNIAKSASDIIAQHGGSAMSELFPKDSISGPSEAVPAIWVRWNEFEKLAMDMEAYAKELSASLEYAALTPVAVEPNMPEKPELSEWEKLDTDLLLGVKTWAQRQNELAQVDQSAPAPDAPAVQRSPQAVYADVSATCAACHQTFRR
ncbi:MAG: cytochrome c [Devosiaceae bacterium]|nr:cytochrome c [Devosiaceae bacterium]